MGGDRRLRSRWWLAARKPWRTNCSPGSKRTDVDGFNLAYAVTHETFRDVVELLCALSCKSAASLTKSTARGPARKLFGGDLVRRLTRAPATAAMRTAASVERR